MNCFRYDVKKPMVKSTSEQDCGRWIKWITKWLNEAKMPKEEQGADILISAFEDKKAIKFVFAMWQLWSKMTEQEN